MRVAVPHDLPVDAATQRVKESIQKLRVQHSGYITHADESWDGNSAKLMLSLKAKGITISVAAEVSVNEHQVVVEGKVPLLAWPAKGKIEDMIRDNLQICLGGP